MRKAAWHTQEEKEEDESRSLVAKRGAHVHQSGGKRNPLHVSNEINTMYEQPAEALYTSHTL